MSVDLLQAIKPRDDSSQAYRDSLAAIDVQRIRVSTEHTRLTAERADLIASGGSDAACVRIEKAIADLGRDRERLDVAVPVQERKLTEALAREAEEARRDKAEVLTECIERWNAYVAGGTYEKAAATIVEGIALERAVYAAQRAFSAATPRAKPVVPGEVVSASTSATIPAIARAYVGGETRTFEALVRLPSLKPGQPALAWWLDPNRPTGPAYAYA